MTLNKQSNVLAWMAAIAVVVLFIVVRFSVNEVRFQNDQINMAEDTVKDITNLRFLVMEMAFYNEQHSREHWREHVAKFSAALDSHYYDSAEENILLEKEKANLKIVRQLYEQLMSSNVGENAQHGPNQISEQPVTNIVRPLFLTTQTMLDDAFQLVRLNRFDLETAQSNATLAMLFSIVMLANLIAIVCLIMKVRVLKPIAALKIGTERVTQGDLSHRLNLAVDNEIGLLAGAFDHMTEELERAGNTTRSTVRMLESKSSELAYMQQQLQVIIDHIPALVDSWDTQFRNRFGNSTYSEWFGITPDQMRGKSMQEIMGLKQFEEIKPYLRTVLNGKSVIFERPITLASGEVRQAVFSYVPDIEGDVVKGFYGFANDVAQLKQAQVTKEKALAQLQGIVDAAQDFAILEGDERGTITLFSKGAENLLGYTAEEIVGKTDAGLFHVPQEIITRSNELTLQYGRRIRGFDTFVELARQGKSESREWTYVRKDGMTIPVNLTVTAIRNQDGAITGYLGIAKDIRKDKEILQLLAEARDKAQAASLSKSQFLANMSHEIRTPMNAILGMLQLLQHTEMSAKQMDYATKTQSAAQSLLALLNDILDFSKVEANKMTLEYVPFHLDTMMRELAVIFASSVGDKNLEILFSTDAKLPTYLVGDVMRLRQILINLVGNAIKFTQQGEVVVSLQIMSQDALHMEVKFSVSDTGIGIEQEQLNFIFEGFSQAEASTSRRFGGTGLGLAICQSLVALMGGELKVESTPNVGSCFNFTLAFERATESEAPAAKSLEVNSKEMTSCRVLIVDDNDSAREVLLGMINYLGWKGDAVASGEEALKVLRQNGSDHCPYDVIFMDWKMPIMDGLETTCQIRQMWQGTHNPVIIMLTAHDGEMLVGRTQNDRELLNGFLVKPVTASMLVDAVTETSNESLHTTAKQRPKRLAGLRVLVVEDTLINQQVAQEFLSSEGAEIELASDGEAGVEKVLTAKTPFDVVLMDIQMPGMDGYAATAKIRQHERMKSLPIIAMTANVLATDKAACWSAGMNDHIGKPIDINEMVGTILRHCAAPEVKETIAKKNAPIVVENVKKDITHHEAPIDFENALKRLGGNQVLLASLARRFASDVELMMIDLQRYLEQGNRDKVLNVMHTLKGVAGTVGAVDLAKYVIDIEAKLKIAETKIDSTNVVARLKILVAQAKRALEALADQWQPTSMSALTDTVEDAAEDAVEFDKAALSIVLDELDILLHGQNMRAIQVFSKLEQKLGGTLKNKVQDQLTPLAHAIDRLDFKSALNYSHQFRTIIQ